jgi:hypothetical protein
MAAWYVITTLLAPPAHAMSGGGYAMMGGSGHMISLHNLVLEATKSGKSLAVFLPQYGKSLN